MPFLGAFNSTESYSLRAYNSIGWSEWSYALIVGGATTYEPAPPTKPTLVVATPRALKFEFELPTEPAHVHAAGPLAR